MVRAPTRGKAPRGWFVDDGSTLAWALRLTSSGRHSRSCDPFWPDPGGAKRKSLPRCSVRPSPATAGFAAVRGGRRPGNAHPVRAQRDRQRRLDHRHRPMRRQRHHRLPASGTDHPRRARPHQSGRRPVRAHRLRRQPLRRDGVDDQHPNLPGRGRGRLCCHGTDGELRDQRLTGGPGRR